MSDKKFILTVALPVLLSIAAGIVIIIFGGRLTVQPHARAVIAEEMSKFRDGIKNLDSEKDELEAKSNEYEKILSENESIITEVESLKQSLDSYNADIASASAQIDDLNSQLEAKKAYLDNLSEINEAEKGESLELSDGEYKCPSQIEAGRYTATGTGTIYLYTISNALRLNEDLSLLDTHSYTFEITSGEMLRVEGNVTITMLNN